MCAGTSSIFSAGSEVDTPSSDHSGNKRRCRPTLAVMPIATLHFGPTGENAGASPCDDSPAFVASRTFAWNRLCNSAHRRAMARARGGHANSGCDRYQRARRAGDKACLPPCHQAPARAVLQPPASHAHRVPPARRHMTHVEELVPCNPNARRTSNLCVYDERVTALKWLGWWMQHLARPRYYLHVACATLSRKPSRLLPCCSNQAPYTYAAWTTNPNTRLHGPWNSPWREQMSIFTHAIVASCSRRHFV